MVVVGKDGGEVDVVARALRVVDVVGTVEESAMMGSAEDIIRFWKSVYLLLR